MFKLSFVFFLGFILPACTASLSQQEVAREFWTAVAADNIDKAKSYVRNNDLSQLGTIDSLLIEKINLKAHQDTNGECLVPTAISTTERGEPKRLSFSTILEKDGSDWKINLSKTSQSLQKSIGNKANF